MVSALSGPHTPQRPCVRACARLTPAAPRTTLPKLLDGRINLADSSSRPLRQTAKAGYQRSREHARDRRATEQCGSTGQSLSTGRRYSSLTVVGRRVLRTTEISVLTSARRQARAPHGFSHLLSTLDGANQG